MCLAELNRSTGPCGHTYFSLNRPCSSTTSLANCAKLSLSGWENRTDTCAVCTGGALVDTINYRVLGGDDAPSGLSNLAANLSRNNSFGTMTTSSLVSARRDSRRGSLARSESSVGSATGPGTQPMTQQASERNASRNQRIDAYLAQLPPAVFRAGQSMYPDQNGGGGAAGNDAGAVQAGDGVRPGVMSKLTKKSRTLSRDFRAFF